MYNAKAYSVSSATSPFSRSTIRLGNPDPRRATIVEGDVLDRARLEAAMEGQDSPELRRR